MEKLSSTMIFKRLCEAANMYGLYFSLDWSEHGMDELFKAIPFLNKDGYQDIQMMLDGGGVILFDTKDELEHHYNQIVGDDGPTELNLYDGPARVYALTCDRLGEFLTENT